MDYSEAIDYPFDDFWTDYSEIKCRLNEFPQNEKQYRGQEIVEEYFQSLALANKHEREQSFSRIVNYIFENQDGFDQGDLAVIGANGSLFSPAILRAVHFFFTEAPEDQRSNPPNADYFVRLIREVESQD